MSLRRSLLGSRVASVEDAAEPAGTSLPPEALATGGLLLIGAGLALIGPLAAAVLIRSRGAVRGDAAATAPLVLAALAVVLAMAAGVALFVSAWRRAHSRPPLPGRQSLPPRGAGGRL